MGMALKIDVAEACKCAGTEKPIDLVHLSRVTMGDKDLELEVLKMFLAQIPNYVDMIKSAKTDEAIYVAAHTLKGAASNVGAFPLAEIAKEAEEAKHFQLNDVIAELGKITDYVADLSQQN